MNDWLRPTVLPDAHVLPRADLIEHTASDDCPCGPADQSVLRDDGSMGWVTVHASLDGRERRE